MTKYAYLQDKLDKLTERQLEKRNRGLGGCWLIELDKVRLRKEMESMTVKEASKRAGLLFKIKHSF
jgi:hypothetical protein